MFRRLEVRTIWPAESPHLLPKSDSVYWVERSDSTANWPSTEDRMTLLAKKLIVSFFTAKLAGVEVLQNAYKINK